MSSVGIFWDFENCHPPSVMSGYTVAEKIKQAVQYLGNISVFKAYFDVNREPTKGAQQHELQCSGISLIHTPHTSGKKDVADKVLLVDLMIFALQGNEKKTIVLIAGDQDYSYAVSMLRSRGHDVFIISSSFSAHRGLGRLASGTWDWEADVLTAETQSRRVFDREFIQEAPFPQVQDTTPLLMNPRTHRSSTPIHMVLEVAIQCLGTILHVALSILKSSVKTCSLGTHSVLRRLMQPIWRAYRPSGPKKAGEAHRTAQEVVTDLESSGECSQAERDDEEPNEIVNQPVSTVVSTGMMTQTSSNCKGIAQIEATASELASETVEYASPLDPHHPSSEWFSLLIAVLKKRKSQGWCSTEYNHLNLLLEEANPQVYRIVGADGFRKHLEAAKDADMIDWEMVSGFVSLCQETGGVSPSVVTGSKQTPVPPTPAPRSRSKPVDSNFRVLVDELRKLRSSRVFAIKRGKLSPIILKRDSDIAARLGMKIKIYINRANQLGYILITPEKKGKSLVSLHPDYY